MENDDKKRLNRKSVRFFIVFILGVGALAAIISSEQATTSVPIQTPLIDSTTQPQATSTDTADTGSDGSDTSTTIITPPVPDTTGQFVPPVNPNIDNNPDNSSQSSPDDSNASTDTTNSTSLTQGPDGATAECNDGTYSTDTDPTTACTDDGGIETIL